MVSWTVILGISIAGVGVLGNVLSIYLFGRKGNKNSMTILILALTTADLFGVIFAIVSNVDVILGTNLSGWRSLDVLDMLRLTCFRVSECLTAFIGMERLYAVARPLKVRLVFTKRIVLRVVAAIYSVIFGMFIALIVYNAVTFTENDAFRKNISFSQDNCVHMTSPQCTEHTTIPYVENSSLPNIVNSTTAYDTNTESLVITTAEPEAELELPPLVSFGTGSFGPEDLMIIIIKTVCCISVFITNIATIIHIIIYHNVRKKLFDVTEQSRVTHEFKIVRTMLLVTTLYLILCVLLPTILFTFGTKLSLSPDDSFTLAYVASIVNSSANFIIFAVSNKEYQQSLMNVCGRSLPGVTTENQAYVVEGIVVP